MHSLETIKRLNGTLPPSPRCRPGDLAVIVVADNKINLGRIVRVIKADDGTGDLHLGGNQVVWFVECAQPLTWSEGKKRYRRKYGPAPDCQLQPIRPEPIQESVSKNVELGAPTSKEKLYVQP
jgi:hypothetical protein